MERERFQIAPSGFWGELSLITGVIIAVIMPLAQETQLGPYEIGAPLGSGGMGEVYRACFTFRRSRTA